MTNNYNYRGAVKSLFALVDRAIVKGFSLQKTADMLRRLVNKFPELNRTERSKIYWSGLTLYRAVRHSPEPEKIIDRRLYFDRILSKCRAAQSSVTLRRKREMYRAAVKKGKIFFICSYHKDCANDHKDYQGKIYVDKFWRQKISGDKYRAVMSYIRNHKTMTVQDVINDKPYLTTRPYCRHYFVPLEIDTVLTSSAGRLKDKFARDRKIQFGEEQYNSLRKEVAIINKKILTKKELT